MAAKKSDVWVVPVSRDPSDNVWVVIAEGRRKGRMVRSLRVFTTEPPEALVDHARRRLGKNATAIVMEVAPDCVTESELSDVAC